MLGIFLPQSDSIWLAIKWLPMLLVGERRGRVVSSFCKHVRKMPNVKTKADKSLGKALINDRFKRRGKKKTVDNGSMLHTTEVQDGYDWGRLNLQSVTEESSFQDFLRTAELAGKEFQAEKLNIAYVAVKSDFGVLSDAERVEMQKKHKDKKSLLTIPRRPKWTMETTPEELRQMENESFLNWRRSLALLQENDDIQMTPYEKNLAFWRQLWRVIERSDVIVQIVDARNPLLFRNEDLEKYVKEIGEEKENMILINKSDFLTDEQRKKWAEFFDQHKIRVVFFSALRAKEAQEQLEAVEEEDEEDNPDIPAAKVLLKKIDKVEEKMSELEKDLSDMMKPKEDKTDDDSWERNNSDVLSPEDLIALFQRVHTHPKKFTEGITTIGLVGYPNVGKSSTINALLTEKKVSVSATPGKTKHFQTLFLQNDLMLCDCPGLVMPSFVLTKAEMILNGILPIDQMRDHVSPINQLCRYIPRHVLEDKYGIMIPKPTGMDDPDRPPHSEELLLAYGYNRGFMTANGQPDQSKGARYILKDFVNGRLLYAYAPPDLVQEEFHVFPERQRAVRTHIPPQEKRAIRLPEAAMSEEEFNAIYFSNIPGEASSKGRKTMPHVRPLSASSSTQSLDSVHIAGKSWKGGKKEKKVKLRKQFAHLDQH
ncbi:large subunit GTPase 1 homolog [Phlebotomus argentipes]|uniref:large subunit GTPase 1 homolog n=1 Tax=Phlebotomus argentipes TaxID=94469 RepID=UPI00289368B4|nr:large subunit GTPase 1 homolog [Phlebotomus argentipes]